MISIFFLQYSTPRDLYFFAIKTRTLSHIQFYKQFKVVLHIQKEHIKLSTSVFAHGALSLWAVVADSTTSTLCICWYRNCHSPRKNYLPHTLTSQAGSLLWICWNAQEYVYIGHRTMERCVDVGHFNVLQINCLLCARFALCFFVISSAILTILCTHTHIFPRIP